MKASKTLLFAVLLTFAITGTALAGKPAPVPDVNVVNVGEITTISVTVENTDRKTELAGIMNVRALDENGGLVANMGRPVVLAPKSKETVTYQWQATSYPTPLTWKAKVAPYREDPIDHNFGWNYPKLQHRLTDEAKNPVTCQNCHVIDYADKEAPMNCYNCHGHYWN